MGVGGVFDYLTGRVPLAPAWLRHLGLEWLYRLAHQPRRWRRILVAVPLFSWRVFCHTLSYGRTPGRRR
jgi:N-acetylglucosaminyldiphosphoundecaprenol N-acetyl-beta-D-mannosaminyltransferase